MIVEIGSILEFDIVKIMYTFNIEVNPFFSILCYCLNRNLKQFCNLIPNFTGTENIVSQKGILIMIHDEFIDAYHQLLL